MVGLPDIGALLDPGFRQPAACVIEMGTARKDIGPIAALVAEVEIQTAREEAATGRIVIEDRRREDGSWVAADSGLFSRWAPIRVSAAFEAHQELILSGYVLKLSPDYPGNAAEAKLTLEVQDEGAALSREQMRRVWGEDAPMSDLAILAELVRDADIAVDGASGQGQSSRQLNQDATPIQFLRERARANGYELIFHDGKVYFGPRRLTGTPQTPILVYAGRTTNARGFAIQDMADTPDAVRVDLAPRETGAAPETATVAPAEAVLGTTPAAAEGAGLGTPSVWRLGREGDETPEEAVARAQALADLHAFKLRATGELDGSLYGHVLRPGAPVTVDGSGPRYGGLYYVDKVTHRMTPDGYVQGFDLMRNATGESAGPLAPLSAAGSAIGGLFAGAAGAAGLASGLR